jgi:hypothetical protein
MQFNPLLPREVVLRRTTRVALLALPFACLAACVGEGDAGSTHAAVSAAGPAGRPGLTTYRCEDGTITVENRASEVVLTDTSGESVTLPAAPPEQRSRYGLPGYALVLEGNQALYVKGGKPMDCAR